MPYKKYITDPSNIHAHHANFKKLFIIKNIKKTWLLTEGFV